MVVVTQPGPGARALSRARRASLVAGFSAACHSPWGRWPCHLFLGYLGAGPANQVLARALL